MMKPRLLVALLAAALILGGCGYAFQRGVNNLPRHIRAVSVPMVENKTIYTDLTNNLTNQLIKQFSLSDFLKVTGPGAADAVLKVRVESVRILSASRAVTREVSLARRVIVEAAGELMAIESEEPLWRGDRVEARRTYPVSDDQAVVEANRQEALEEIARELAVKIHDNIFEGF